MFIEAMGYATSRQFVAPAVGEKMSALLTEKYLLVRSKKGNETAFLEAMAKVSDLAPDESAKMEEKVGKSRFHDIGQAVKTVL